MGFTVHDVPVDPNLVRQIDHTRKAVRWLWALALVEFAMNALLLYLFLRGHK